MSLTTVQLPDLVIPDGSNVSNVLNANKCYDDAEDIMLYGPATLEALTYTIENNSNPDATNASTGWTTLQIGDPAGDAAPPAATKARSYYELATSFAFRIKASSNATGAKTWKVSKSTYN